MAILEILKYPDPRLREVSLPVKDFDSQLKGFYQDLLDTMYAERGIGLAAPQVGKLWQMLVIDTREAYAKKDASPPDLSSSDLPVPKPLSGAVLSEEPEDFLRSDSSSDSSDEDSQALYITELEAKIAQPLVLINPKILLGLDKTSYQEGCLSVPSFYETVERKKWIRCAYQDLDGTPQTLEVDGLLAIAIQHELDHLEGTLFIDRLSMIKSMRIKNTIRKKGYAPQ